MNTEYSDYTTRIAEANRRNKTSVFDALAKAEITHVLVAFDGEGDQGQMEHASAQANGKVVAFPQTKLILWIADFGSTVLSRREFELREGIEHLCCGYLEDQHGGWEIDEGSFGEFTFDVAAQTITLDFYGRLVETVFSRDTL